LQSLEEELARYKKTNKDFRKVNETLYCENKVFQEECDELYNKKQKKEEQYKELKETVEMLRTEIGKTEE
jgi:chromosome segregation ATPase